MIDAIEVARSIRLPAPDEAEVERLGQEIIGVIRAKNYDGRPVFAEIPVGEDEEQRDRSNRIALALQRAFQMRGWVAEVQTVADAFGEPQVHRLGFAIDPAVFRERVASAPAEARFSLRGLHDELAIALGVSDEGAPALPVEPKVSVLLGTCNRLPLLRQAIRSIRRSVGDLTYEIVVVDGGSTDGTRAWLAAQPDVLLVGEHRLEGAVRAFNQAFSLSRGEFVANANDDVRYEGLALAEGVRYLREHPEVGQVAFALRGEGEDYVVNEVYPGNPGTTYANHGVIRRFVAEKVARIAGGFWPPVYHTYAGDCEMSAWVWRLGCEVRALSHLRVLDARPSDALRKKNQEHFGSDTRRMYARWPAASFRSDGPLPRVGPEEIARYRAEVEGGAPGRNSPEVIRGMLGDGNRAGGAPSSIDALEVMVELVGLPEPGEERRLRRTAPLLRALDPRGTFPKRAERLTRERVLHVSQCTEKDPQAGLVRALRELGSEGYQEVRWYEDYREDHVGRQEAVVRAAERFKPTLVFMQLEGPAIDSETVRKIRFTSPPGVVVATWSGDISAWNSPWGVDGKGADERQVALGRVCDLVLHSSMTHVRILRAAGIHCAAYLQIGYDEEQYRPQTLEERLDSLIYDFDVVFLGSKYGAGDAFSSVYKWKNGSPAHDSVLRDEVVRKMRDAFGGRFGIFGSGWDKEKLCVRGSKSRGPCDCSPIEPVAVLQSHEVYWRSRIGLSVSLDNKLECYTSDRLFRILGCGVLLLVKRFPGMEVLGLREGENCSAFDTAEEAVDRVIAIGKFSTGTADARQYAEMVEAGARLAREHHTWSVRMRELQVYLDVVREARG